MNSGFAVPFAPLQNTLGIKLIKSHLYRNWTFLKSNMTAYSDLLGLGISFSGVSFLGLLQF